MKKGFADSLFLIFLFLLFLIISLIFLFIAIFSAASYQENIQQEIQNLDTYTTLNALLNYPHQGKPLALWITQTYTESSPERRKLYETLTEEGIRTFFKNSDLYVTIIIFPEEKTSLLYKHGFTFSKEKQPVITQRFHDEVAGAPATQHLPHNLVISLGVANLGGNHA